MDGRVALITGGSRGIGFGIARALLDAGASVVITGRKSDDLDRAAAELDAGGAVLAVAGSSHDAEHRRDATGQAVARFGRVDCSSTTPRRTRSTGRSSRRTSLRCARSSR